MSVSQKLSAAFIVILLSFPVFNYSQKVSKKKPTTIPNEVADVMDTNLPARQARLDIPLSFLKTLYFPYQNEYFTCFFLRIKNMALGYTPTLLEEKKIESEEIRKQEVAKDVEEKEEILSCNVDFFFRIYSLDKDGKVGGIHKEIYVAWNDQEKSKEYNPDKENIYSFGTIFPPGHYLFCAAAANMDLTKIGLTFQEFYLPSTPDFKQNLGFTPLFFIKSMKRIPTPDPVIKIFKNIFHYSTLEIEPFFDHEFSVTEKLDILYFILGGTPSDQSKYDFEVSYVYKKGEEEVAKFKPQILKDIPAPIVSLQLHLLFKEIKLEAGDYILEIKAKDNIGKKEGTGRIPFVVK